MMKLVVTGNLRSIANSAWVSTLEESKASAKSDEEVIRVTKFLVEHYHTTPFECVTLSFIKSKSEEDEDGSSLGWDMSPFIYSGYARYDGSDDSHEILTIDLFNFIKICKRDFNSNYREHEFWKIFQAQEPLMASVVDGFGPPPKHDPPAVDYDAVLGSDHGIGVELIEVHNPGSSDHLRATWRVCCPLSIAVQILRHRTGSFNMTSGRYRTLNQDMVTIYDDILLISDKLDIQDSISQIISRDIGAFEDYQWMMGVAKTGKANDAITNEEYKRFREFVRYILPEGRMTELYITFYHDDFIHYLELRDSHHAQVEHAYIARKMDQLLNNFLSK